ncbi:hypothetical protein ACLMAL_28700 [Nocardia sp. CWNU-33]|uniref:hypothetical protein n=1 Tax=Nocardia sp. CWNU-33 TaxID=3392117 RepID=UPI00398ECE73
MNARDVVAGRFADRNRYAAPCGRCSVLVRARGGVVRDNSVMGKALMCLTCLGIEHDPDAEIRQSTPHAAAWVTVLVLGLTRACRLCGEEVVCVSGLYPYQPAPGYRNLITTQDEDGILLATAAGLLDRIGRRDITDTIGSVYSQSLKAWTIAVSCPHCRGLQGNYFVGEETMGRVRTDGIAGLEVLGRVPCVTPEWQLIVHDPHFARLSF